MTMSNGTLPDPDDFFADTRMTFGDHIEDLRTHLWRAIKGFGVALVLSFFIGKTVVNFITAPVKNELSRYYEHRTRKLLKEQSSNPELAGITRPSQFFEVQIPRRQAEALLNRKDPAMKRPVIVTKEQQQARKGNESWWSRYIGRWFSDNPEQDIPPEEKDNVHQIPEQDQGKELTSLWMRYQNPLEAQGSVQGALRKLLETDNPTTLSAQEAFMVWFKVCLITGVVLGSPWIFWQIWSFVAAGLYPSEKRLVHVYLPVSLFLFLAGVVICELFVVPKAIEALLWFNEWMGLKPDIRLNEWLGFAIFMPVVFGLSFQTPLVMMFLGRLGIMTPDSFRNKRRYAWFAMAVFAAIVTPSVDALSMIFLWVPMSLLFELGIILMKWTPHGQPLDEEVPDSEEMVEV
jgi:sec-independent protein translocase protein TatC